MQIESADAVIAEHHLRQLIDLLVQAVDGGASIGWLPPMQPSAAEDYWRGRIAAIHAGTCILLLVWDHNAIVGTAQLGLEQRENGNHRAEVQKVIVHPDHRRRGIARQLMHALEEQAIQHNRSLLFLDTREGDPAEALYRGLGYVRVGAIPNYVRATGGGFEATVVYYKILT